MADTVHQIAGSEGPPLTAVVPASTWPGIEWGELWRYRELVGFLVWRDLKVRYKQTVLGAAWAVLQPLLTTIVFSVIFGRWARMPSSGLPYPLFVFAGLLPWTFFANAVGQSGNILIGNTNLVNKVYFPRLVIPFASVAAGLLDLAIVLLAMLVLMVAYGAPFTARLLLLPLPLAIGLVTAVGLASALSALTAAYRDFRYVIPFMVQIWMFASPVIYPVDIVPTQWRLLFFANPMAGVVAGCRYAWLGTPVDAWLLAVSAATAVVIFVAGLAYFRIAEQRLADVI